MRITDEFITVFRDLAYIGAEQDRLDRMSNMHIWCEQNCSSEFHLCWYGDTKLYAEFKLEQDAILFSLSWS